MKLQDILFVFSMGTLIAFKRPLIFVWIGLAGLAFAIPLFALWVFFTAERLTWYAASFFLVFLIISFIKPHTIQ